MHEAPNRIANETSNFTVRVQVIVLIVVGDNDFQGEVSPTHVRLKSSFCLPYFWASLYFGWVFVLRNEKSWEFLKSHFKNCIN